MKLDIFIRDFHVAVVVVVRVYFGGHTISANRMALKIQQHAITCIKTFLITAVYSIVKVFFTAMGSFTYAQNVLYMLFFVSSIHSLKKSQ